MIGIQPGYQPLKTSCQCAFLDPLTKHSPQCPKTDEKNMFLDRDSTWNAGFESKCTNQLATQFAPKYRLKSSQKCPKIFNIGPREHLSCGALIL